ncbi:MAG: hypothetical protein ACI4DU_02340 [Lachnospiraceae bacterium]
MGNNGESKTMEEEKTSLREFLTNWFFFLYFLILFGERTQSILRSVKDSELELFGSGFHIYVYLLTFASLAGFLILLLFCNKMFLRSLFVRKTKVQNLVNYKMLCITGGVELLSGMVHTEYTVAPIQFAAYGMLIVAMILRTAYFQKETARKALLWLSLGYLVALSMAIPVVYESGLANANIFHFTEAVVSALLVFLFTYMLELVFLGKAENLFLVWPILVAAIGDAFVLWLRWEEEINLFVLVSLVIAMVLWLIGFIMEKMKKQ